MNSFALSEIPKALQEIDRVPPHLLVKPVHGSSQLVHRLVPAVMADFLFERFPRLLLRVLFGRVDRKLYDSDSPVLFEPFLHLVARVMSGPVQPHTRRNGH